MPGLDPGIFFVAAKKIAGSSPAMMSVGHRLASEHRLVEFHHGSRARDDLRVK
jgi:hypothetical protein